MASPGHSWDPRKSSPWRPLSTSVWLPTAAPPHWRLPPSITSPSPRRDNISFGTACPIHATRGGRRNLIVTGIILGVGKVRALRTWTCVGPTPILSQKQLRKAAQSDGTDQNRETDPTPAVPAQRHDAETIQHRDQRHHQEEWAGDVAVHASAADSVDYASRAHDAERRSPNGCPPTAEIRPRCYRNRDPRKPKQSKR